MDANANAKKNHKLCAFNRGATTKKDGMYQKRFAKFNVGHFLPNIALGSDGTIGNNRDQINKLF